MTQIDHPAFGEPDVVRLYKALNADGHVARIVGGAVRNALLGEPLTDIDFATTTTPDETILRVEAAGFSTVPVGIEHGTVLCVAPGGASHEVTTLREDVETDGRHAIVRFGHDWMADATRRDFTMNALYRSMDGTLFDPLGGLADVRARRVRFIGSARQRIAEDALRILRFYRFRAQYGAAEEDGEGESACVEARDSLASLSGERLWSEFAKLFLAPHAVREVERLVSGDLITPWLGVAPADNSDEIGARIERLQAFESAAGRPRDAVLRWALIVPPDEAPTLAERLRLSRAERERLIHVVDDARSLVREPSTASRWQLHEWGRERFEAAVLVAFSMLADGDPKALFALDVPPFRLTGKDVLALGVPPGPEVGRRLERARRRWRERGFPEGDQTRLLDEEA